MNRAEATKIRNSFQSSPLSQEGRYCARGEG